MEYKYLISIVMAIYNSEPWLRETLDSVVNQDIRRFDRPFEEIVQVIMVDDGCTDGTNEIIDEYAAAHPNFIAVHKQNGGVASARNEGLKYVEGKYMNFLDSDDKFSKNVLWEMYSFFEKHYDETDVVTMPLYFFDAQHGEHWQNGKFKKGNRIINLFRDYDATLLVTNATFIKSEYRTLKFDEIIPVGEDAKFVNTVITEKMTMGVVSRCKYYYRKRSTGTESLISTHHNKIEWYIDYFDRFYGWCVSFSKSKWGYVPLYFQTLLLKEISWRFKDNYELKAKALLGDNGFKEYKKRLFSTLNEIDDSVIISFKNFFIEQKIFVLSKKYQVLPKLIECNNDFGLAYGIKLLCWVSDFASYIDFMNINNNRLIIEGYIMICGIPDDEPVDVKLIVRKDDEAQEIIPCSVVEKRDINQYKLEETLFRGIPFAGEVVLHDDESKAEISLAIVVRGVLIEKKDIRFREYSPIGKEYGKAYYTKDGYLLTRKNNKLYFEVCSKDEEKKREKAFMTVLKESNKDSDKKAYKALTAYKILKKFLHRKIWLVSDRVNKADDNGEALFKYLCEIKPKDVEVYFVINEDCDDYMHIRKLGKVAPYFSHKHKLLYLIADVIISSQADNHVTNPFGKFLAPYRQFISTKKYVFLQHGITQNDLSGWINKYSKPTLRGFVTSSPYEHKSIICGNYFLSEKCVWLTGFPRYDLLYNDEKKYITIMPTWRKALMKISRGVWYPDNKFDSSEYCQFYNSLINDERLLASAKKFGFKICFMPHVNTQSCLEYFHQNEEVTFWGLNKSYREIFAESNMIITDYSSVAFDFAYLHKPLIYTQFDKEEFFNGEHVCTQGYFDYERDGFGEVTYDLDSTVDLIIDYMKNGCQLKDKYRKRIDSFYAFHDKNNCQRVYEKIIEMLEDK